MNCIVKMIHEIVECERAVNEWNEKHKAIKDIYSDRKSTQTIDCNKSRRRLSRALAQPTHYDMYPHKYYTYDSQSSIVALACTEFLYS